MSMAATALRADVAANAADRALLKRFGVYGPPTIAFFSGNGRERSRYRVVGYLDGPQFAGRCTPLSARSVPPPDITTGSEGTAQTDESRRVSPRPSRDSSLGHKNRHLDVNRWIRVPSAACNHAISVEVVSMHRRQLLMSAATLALPALSL